MGLMELVDGRRLHSVATLNQSEDEILPKRRIRRLETAVKGFAVIKDLEYLPANSALHQMPPD